jgi:hypothetical protein
MSARARRTRVAARPALLELRAQLLVLLAQRVVDRAERRELALILARPANSMRRRGWRRRGRRGSGAAARWRAQRGASGAGLRQQRAAAGNNSPFF